jgi:fimbrial chaperone protein
MQGMLRPALALALGLLVLGAASEASGGNLLVAPTRLDLGAANMAGALSLQNRAAEPVVVQVQTFAWTGSLRTADLGPTNDLIAVPPMASIAPGQSQIIRVALRRPPGGKRESAYRLLITEVPPQAGGGRRAVRAAPQPAGIRDAARAAPRPAWQVHHEGGRTVLELANNGDAHLQVKRIRLTSGARVTTLDQPAYVLAGQKQVWPVPDPGAAPVVIEADTSLGSLSQQIAPSR